MASSDSDSIQLFEDYHKNNKNSSSSSREGTSSPPDSRTTIIKPNNNKGKCKGQRPGKVIVVNPKPPPVAVPEKIIFCIDNSSDKGIGYTYSFDDNETIGPEPWSIRNQAIHMYITNKFAIANKTGFAIAAVEPGNVKILTELCEDYSVTDSLPALKGIDIENITDYDITPMFDTVLKMVKPPPIQSNVEIIPPDYIIRIIFIYGNSHREPKINTEDLSYIEFMKSPYCTLDVLYLHEIQSDFNNVAAIFNVLEEIVTPQSYVLECSRDVTKVFNNMAKLLAHPCQRVPQNVWLY